MRRLTVSLLLAALGGLLLTAWAGSAGAAGAPPQTRKCAAPTVKQAARGADVVFTGVLDKGTSAQDSTYSFQAEQLYAGHLTSPSVLVRASSSCPLARLRPGKEYVVFARERQGALVSGTDDGTTRATRQVVRQVEQALGKGESLGATAQPSTKPTYTRVASGQPASLSRVAAPGVALVLVGLLGLLVVRRRA